MRRINLCAVGFIWLLLATLPSAGASGKLPRSAPEREGVSSRNISEFLEAIKNSKHEFHSFMMLRHGKVVAEGWWKPYGPDLKHTMYSVTKSFSSTAIGFAVAEGKLSLSDTAVSFFPEFAPSTGYMTNLTLKDLITMSAGQDPDPTSKVNVTTNWVEQFFKTPVVHPPGTRFLYNSIASHMLGAILRKATGQNLAEYLQPRLFDPLGIRDYDWETDPSGINTGGWGLRIKTEDMAKFGQLLLQKGAWNGKQILPKEWIADATSQKILQSPAATQEQREKSDWLQGYGYQFWVSRHGFRADGAFGQFIIVLPEKDAVIAITSETKDMQGILNLVYEHLLPAFHENPLPKGESAQLSKTLSSLELPPPQKSTNRSISVSGKTFEFDGKTLAFHFSNSRCVAVLTETNGTHRLSFGHGSWAPGETRRLGPYLVANAQNALNGLAPFRVAGAYYWPSSNILELTLRYIESPHSETIRAEFNGDEATLEIKNSLDPKNPVRLKGKTK